MPIGPDTNWPSTLPLKPLREGYSETPGNALISSAMDIGPPKVRRRTSSQPSAIQMAFVLSYAETAIFRTWFNDTLRRGALTFDFGAPGAPFLTDLSIATEEGDVITTEEGATLEVEYPWTETHVYRFVPTGQPWQIQPMDVLYRLSVNLLQLDA